MVFPVVIYGCEGWAIKKAECWRIDAFELWCWRRLYWIEESLGQQGDPTSPSQRKSTLDIHWKDWGWSWNSNTSASWCKELTHWKRPWCWERLKAGGQGDDRGWDGWMASPTWWTWVWVNSRSWWWTGRPDVLQSMGLQRVGHDWVTDLKQLLKFKVLASNRVPLTFFYTVYRNLYEDLAMPWADDVNIKDFKYLFMFWSKLD